MPDWDDCWLPCLIGLLIFALAFYLVDTVGCPTKPCGVGTVAGKSWEPSHTWTSTSTDSKGNTSTETHWEPDHFRILVYFESHSTKYEVSQDFYSRTRQDTAIQMLESKGRITGWRYVWLGDIITDGRSW